MRPFKQNESGMTKTALIIIPGTPQGYSGTIQQTEVRKKENQAVVSANVSMYSLGGSI